MSGESTSESHEEFPVTQKSSQFSQSLKEWFDGGGRNERQVFAVLHPMAQGLHRIELSASLFEFGRFPERKESYNFYGLGNHDLRDSISGKHCYFERDTAENVTYLYDTSRFGTFINEKLVGKGSSRRLMNGDLISLCDAKFYAFLYVEAKETSDAFPYELTSRYLVSNLIIGEGAMGKVYVGKRRADTSVAVAIKAIPKKHISVVQEHHQNGSAADVIKREVEIMLSVKHPNCVRLEHMCESKTMAYIVMEYVEGGELFARIVAKENQGMGLGETVTKFYAWQLFTAVQYLHKNGIVHRDIKPENVLLLKNDVYTVAKLTDFGLSRTTAERSLETFCGTKCYMAPEQWKAEHYGRKVDIWAVGALIFTCMCGYPPFSTDYDDWSLKEQILKGRLVFYEIWDQISDTARLFVRQCLKINPEDRLSAQQALSSEWFKDPVVAEANRIVQRYADEMGC